MLSEVRKLEKQLGVTPIHLDVFGGNAIERGMAIMTYLTTLRAML